ncbi:hypothetical protein [Microbacterium sp. NPDC096154]|uniref:hypothetical protein n=1 Tax=Microbacterium sp. NPDC096154 TaxID=3155549 RepID=UPI0033338F50
MLRSALITVPLLALLLAGCGASSEPSDAAVDGSSPQDGASAQACEAASLTLEPTRGAPGDTIEVSGDGYVVCEDSIAASSGPSGADPVTLVRLFWTQGGGQKVLGEARVGEDGSLEGTFTVPEDARAGDAKVGAGDNLHVSSEAVKFTVE